ncbi:unnamed protein product [Lampetra planeri]
MTEVSCERWAGPCSLGAVDMWTLRSPRVTVELLTLGARHQEHQLLRPHGAQGRRGCWASTSPRAIWRADQVDVGVQLSLTSEEGDQGFPGRVQVSVTYRLQGETLTVEYEAESSKTTPINLTNHSYFNLAGQAAADIYDHEVSISAASYLPVDDASIPTECVTQPVGGVLEVSTSQPGVQFYTANALDGSLTGKGGASYRKHCSFCLETQNWPDAVNQASFPDCLLRPGDKYRQVTRLAFTAV